MHIVKMRLRDQVIQIHAADIIGCKQYHMVGMQLLDHLRRVIKNGIDLRYLKDPLFL